MTDAEIIADIFGSPCDYSLVDEFAADPIENKKCGENCGKYTDAECWQRYFDLKRRKEDKQ